MAKKSLPKAKPRQPLWDWTKGLTQSSLNMWLGCREQFALNYVEGMTPKGFSIPLEFGTVIHLAIQRQDEVTSRKSALDLICEITEAYHTARFPQLRSKQDREACSRTMAAAEATFPAYYEHVQDDDSKQDWIAREQLFRVRHQFNLSTNPVPLHGGLVEIDLRGMRDGTYRTKKAGLLGLFETKTKSQIDDNAIMSGLRADLQSMFYLFTLLLEYKEVPKEILHNVIRRPGQKYLERDTIKSFRERIIADIKKRPDYYFRRYLVNVLPSDLDTFQTKVLDPTLRVLYEWWEEIKDHPFDRWRSPSHYLNLSALYTKYGPAPLYGLMVLGKARDYYVRSSTFPELHDATLPSQKAS